MRRKEIMEAATKGIRDYLETIRGANTCGADAKVECHTNALAVTFGNGETLVLNVMEY